MAFTNRSDEDCGIFMKQESVMSLYEPTPMSPTSTKVFLHPSAHDNNGTQLTAQMKRNASYGNLTNETEARVLVLYTGEFNEVLILIEWIVGFFCSWVDLVF